VTAKSETPEAQRLNAVAVALQRRDAKTAALLAEFELGKGVRHPLLFTARALGLSEAGRHHDALADFERAAQLSPGNPAAWSAVGICRSKIGRHEDAVEAFDRAIALRPDLADFHYRRGRALEQTQDRAAAGSAFLRALECQSDHAPALGRLAFAAAQRGAAAEARAYADRLLRLDARHQTGRFVQIMLDIRENRLEDADAKLAVLLADPTLDEQNRAAALGELGDLRDRQERFSDAIEAYSQANRISSKLLVATTAADGNSLAETVRSLIGYFETKERLMRAVAPISPAKGHAFLLGFPRSGTTLLEQVLASHPDVVTLEERGLDIDVVRRFMSVPGGLDGLYSASEQTLDTYRALYWQRVRKYGVDFQNKVFIDKDPMHTVFLPVIMKLFPDAKILFAIRDPRDVVLSCFRTRLGMNATRYELLTLDGAADFYADVMRLAEIYRAVLPMDVYEVRHEAFVRNFDSEARKLCDALGLVWDDSMRNFAERSKAGSVSSVSGPQLAQGLSDEGIGRWRRYEAHLAPILPVLQPWVEKFCYQ
jgi:tetratricopeptide (TPR) repeat protein